MEIKTIMYDPNELPVYSVRAYSIATKKTYPLTKKGDIWIIDLPNYLETELQFYQLLINEQFFIPDFTKKCIVRDKNIVSVLSETRKTDISPKIKQVSLSKNISINKEEKNIRPSSKSVKFSSLDHRLHCTCILKDVTVDFPIVTKIYNKDRIVFLFDEWIEKSNSHSNFERTFYFSVNTAQFSNGLWNIELETPCEKHISQFEFFRYTHPSPIIFDTTV